MKKFHRSFSTFAIIFLIFLLVFQSRNLWLSFDTEDEDSKKVGEVKEFLEEILTPQRIVANLGDREHYMTTDIGEYWKLTAEDISEKLQKANSENLKLIDTEEYLNLQEQILLFYLYPILEF